jgi:asparagine synthase (glutamine-hydrolysing)
MSAICGIWSFDGRPVEVKDIGAMTDRLAHRGPDGRGVWCKNAIGLGHRRLATTSESIVEQLPLTRGYGRLAITADARIDNATNLASVLGIGRHEGIGDAHLILAAYERWGADAPQHLVGDFAFAIWDAGRQTLFCARDRMGIKPFYYYQSPELFVFGSEIKAVFAHPDIPRLLNEAKIADHLQWNFDDAESTFYRGVVRLPAAHSLTVTAQSVRARRYWSLDCHGELRLRSDEEYAEAFREIFVEAVRCRTRSAFPVGSTLSGGLDSSSIACAAHRVVPETLRPLRTFSAVFPSLPERERVYIDERSYVQAVLKQGYFDHSYICADRVSPLHDWGRMLGQLDEACSAPNLYLHWGLYKAASRKGVRILLDGLDGDTAVSHGLSYLTDLVRTGRWVRFVRESRALARRNPRLYPIRGVVWQLGIKPMVPGSLVRGWRAWRSARRPHRDGCEIIRQSFAERVHGRNTALGNGRTESTVFETARQGHSRALSAALVSSVMELADAASSSFAIEARYPFFDQRLIEFCVAIPAEQKLRDGWTRAVMRRGMAGILPPEVQWRLDKADLSVNFRRRLFEDDRSIIGEVVTSGLASLEEYVDTQGIRDMYGRWLEQPMQRTWDAVRLHTVVTLALWLRSFGMPQSRF